MNAKVHLVAQLQAVLALQRVGFVPDGDVILTGTAQETGSCRAPGTGTDEWTAPHGQEGIGARWLVDHGVVGDFALVGEPTGFSICTAQAGYLRLRIRLTGLMPYTPFMTRAPGGPSRNPVERSAQVVTALVAWAERYARTQATDVPGGRVVPRAQVQEIRSPFPAFTNRCDQCDVYVDVRTPPMSSPLVIIRGLAAELREAGHEVAVECCGYKRGYLSSGAEPLIEAVRASHRGVFGSDPLPPDPAQMSMWQDTNAFNEVGIPAISYGIRPRTEKSTREGVRALHVDDLLALVNVYARVIRQMLRMR